MTKIEQRIIFLKIISTAICGEPPAIDRAVISAGGIVEGSTRTYTCNVNTVTEGSTMISCGPTGKWSVTNLYCRRKYIVRLCTVKHGYDEHNLNEYKLTSS